MLLEEGVVGHLVGEIDFNVAPVRLLLRTCTTLRTEPRATSIRNFPPYIGPRNVPLKQTTVPCLLIWCGGNDLASVMVMVWPSLPH